MLEAPLFRTILIALSLLVAPAAKATDVSPTVSRYIYQDLMTWINAPRIVAAVLEQNLRNRDLPEADISSHQTIWQNETDIKAAVTNGEARTTPLSDLLREHKRKSKGRISEIIVIDRKNLTVASTRDTSDIWHGDQPIFEHTYFKGSGAIYVGDIRLDDTTQTHRGQVSFALTEPATGDVIGAVAVGLNADAFN